MTIAPDETSPPPPTPAMPPPAGPALWGKFKRLTQLGWPRDFPLVQFPNAPLIIAFIAGEVATHSHGSGHAGAQAMSYLAIAIWAYEELFQGVNWFRNLLGLTYIVSTAVHLTLALQR